MCTKNANVLTGAEHPRARPMLGVALALLTIAVFGRTLGNGFVEYDDNQYITINSNVQNGLTVDGVVWALTTHIASNWHPLTWISHMLDVSIFGIERPWGHHLVNLLLHVANVVLLYVLLLRMTGALWRSALVAALFAVHPLHVESVAWVAERKDVLSTLFGLLAMLAYVRWVRSREGIAPRRSRGRRDYLSMVVCFAMSLMAKPMLVTLPCVLLLFDVWPLQRPRTWQLIIEKLPLFALSIASSIVTLWAQAQGGALSFRLSMAQRIANAIVAYATYVWKALWPVDLVAIYSHPGSWPRSTIALAAGTLLAITLIACAFAWRIRLAPLIGWLFYLGTLVPVIGLVQVGSQAMADRYTYVPLIGVFMMVAWMLPATPSAMIRRLIAAAFIAVIAGLSTITVIQIGFWNNSITLFERALAATQRNYIAHVNLSYVLAREGNFAAASQHFAEALQINPGHAITYDFLGRELVLQKRWPDVLAHAKMVLQDEPENANALNDSASALLNMGRTGEAISQWRRAIAADPDHAASHSNLGTALLQQQRLVEAETHLRKAISLKPELAEAHANLGLVLAMQNRLDEAISEFEAALRIQPDFSEAQQYLQTAREQRANPLPQ